MASLVPLPLTNPDLFCVMVVMGLILASDWSIVGEVDHVTFILPDGHGGACEPNGWNFVVTGNAIKHSDVCIRTPQSPNSFHLGCHLVQVLLSFSFYEEFRPLLRGLSVKRVRGLVGR